MANTKKDLVKAFQAVVEDILDNYDRYNDSEKQQVQNALQNLSNLNKNLDRHDNKLNQAVQDICNKVTKAWNNFFGK